MIKKTTKLRFPLVGNINVDTHKIAKKKTPRQSKVRYSRTESRAIKHVFLLQSLKERWSNISTTYKTIALVTISSIIVIVSVFLYYAITTPPSPLIARSSHATLKDRAKDKNVNNKLVPPNPEHPLPAPKSSTLQTFKSLAICSDSKICGYIGRSMFQKNGSIVDATIATMFCNGLITMESMGIGGGFIMNIYIKNDGKAYTLNAKEQAPSNINNYYNNNKENNEQKISSFDGAHSIAIPGELRGYMEAHKRFGLLKWYDLIEPTIQLCEKGFTMSKHMYSFLPDEIKSNSIFGPMVMNISTAKVHKPGTHIYPPKILCNTYRMIATNGGDDFYEGELSKMIADDLKDAGSTISENDLKSYRAKWSESLPIPMEDQIMYITPPPSNGPLIAFILNVLKGYSFSRDSIKREKATIQTYHRIIETFKYAYAKRSQLSDPEYLNVDEIVKNLTSTEYADDIRKLINEYKTFSDPKHYGLNLYTNLQSHGTSHFSILAPNGDAVSVTSSINYYFGSKIIGTRTGIIFNNGINDFTLPNITDDNYFNLPATQYNLLKPGARAVTSMAPIIISDQQSGNVTLVIGGAGGSRIPSAIALVLIRYLFFNNNIKEAIDAPRFHHQTSPMVLLYEYGLLESYVAGLEAMGHQTNRIQINNIIYAIERKSNGVFANVDYRKNGEAVGV